MGKQFQEQEPWQECFIFELTDGTFQIGYEVPEKCPEGFKREYTIAKIKWNHGKPLVRLPNGQEMEIVDLHPES